MWNDPLTKKLLPSKFNHILVSTVHTCCWFDLCPELWMVLCTHCKVVQSKSNTQHVVAFNFQNEHFESLFFRPLFYLTFTLCVPCCRFPCFLPFAVFYSIDFFSSFQQLCVFQMLTIYLLAHPFSKRRKSYYGSCVFYSRKSFVWFRFIYTDCIYLHMYMGTGDSQCLCKFLIIPIVYIPKQLEIVVAVVYLSLKTPIFLLDFHRILWLCGEYMVNMSLKAKPKPNRTETHFNMNNINTRTKNLKRMPHVIRLPPTLSKCL